MLIFYDAAVVPGEIIPCNFTIIKAMLLDVVVILIWYNHMKFLSFDYPHVSTTYRTCSCCPGFCFVSALTTSSGSKILAPFTRCCKIYFQLLCGKGWGTRLLLIIGKKICYMNWNKCSNRAETSNLSTKLFWCGTAEYVLPEVCLVFSNMHLLVPILWKWKSKIK